MRLRIMSLNLRYDKPDPGDNAWKVRRKAVAALMKHYAPDVIGTQEGKPHQLYDLQGLLADYQMVGGDRSGGGKDEHCAILYREEQLKCLNTEDFFLSYTPEIPGSISPDWGNPIPRMVTKAVFGNTANSKKITVFNTHLDYRSARARELSAELICSRMGNIDPADSYLFLTGDFNAEPATLARETFLRQMSNQVQLEDALSSLELRQQLSFHDFTGKAFAAIDTIYYDSRVSLAKAKVDTANWDDIWASDHFAVIGDFII